MAAGRLLRAACHPAPQASLFPFSARGALARAQWRPCRAVSVSPHLLPVAVPKRLAWLGRRGFGPWQSCHVLRMLCTAWPFPCKRHVPSSSTALNAPCVPALCPACAASSFTHGGRQQAGQAQKPGRNSEVDGCMTVAGCASSSTCPCSYMMEGHHTVQPPPKTSAPTQHSFPSTQLSFEGHKRKRALVHDHRIRLWGA